MFGVQYNLKTELLLWWAKRVQGPEVRNVSVKIPCPASCLALFAILVAETLLEM